MKTVNVTYKNIKNQTETATFEVYPKATTAREDIPWGAQRIGRDEWADEDDVYAVEIAAGQLAGVRDGETFWIVRK